MRKVFVVGPNPGTGKTTTAINLAASSALAGVRVLLVDADPTCAIAATLDLGRHPGRSPLHDWPGILYPDVVAGMDLLSLHEDGRQRQEALSGLLASPLLAECYTCAVIDAPAVPRELLADAELVVVARADSLACRTLPGFLASLPATSRVSLLLTLPAEPGVTAERELRQRLGERVLGPMVPHDPEVGLALMFGQPLVVRAPESPAATAYCRLAELLKLVQPSGQRARRLLRQTVPATAAASLGPGEAGTDEEGEEEADPASWEQEMPALIPPAAVTPMSAVATQRWSDDAQISLLLGVTGGLLLLLGGSSRWAMALGLGILSAGLLNWLLARLFPEGEPPG